MLIGKGAYGAVKADGSNAVKKFLSINPLVAEAFVTRYVSGLPNIITIKECNFSSLTMSTQRWHCSLDAVINFNLSLLQRRDIHICIMKGLCDLEAMHIVHADLKPSNVFLDKTMHRAVLGDFGLSSLSNSAKVMYTAPGFSQERENVKSHRSHDCYSFVILTLQLLYGYKVNKVVPDKHTLRGIVRKMVLNEKACNVLCNLIKDDDVSCLTMKEALYQLYDIVYSTEVPILKRIVDVRINAIIPAIEKTIFAIKQKYKIKRRFRCIDCIVSTLSTIAVLSDGFSNKQTHDKSRVTRYTWTMAYIFFCVFGTSEYTEKNRRLSIEIVCREASCVEKDVYACMNTILDDKNIVSLMFY